METLTIHPEVLEGYENTVFNPAREIPVTEEEMKAHLLKFYEVAGPDYQAWSKNMNMHFGFFKWGANPFMRERMLDTMNEEVISRFKFPEIEDVHILDMGCGFAATSRYAAQHHPKWNLTGISIVADQVSLAEKLSSRDKVGKQVNIVQGDYIDMPFRSHSFDGVYAIESCCHSAGNSKHDFVKEMCRVLKPGRKFVVADAFLKHNRPLKGFINKSYRRLCDCWALTEMGDINAFVKELEDNGFKDITVEDISWNVAPSVAHVPFVISSFLFKEMVIKGQKLKKERWDNLMASFLSIIVGMSRKNFGYYIISGTKGHK